MKKNQGFFLLTASTVIASVINFIFSIVSKRYIPPYEYGVFTACTILESYMGYLQLGSINAYNRDYSQLLGAGKNEEASKLRNSVFTFICLIYGFFFIVLELFFGLIMGKTLEPLYLYGYMISVVIACLAQLESFEMNTVRIWGNFNFSAVVGLIKAVVPFIIGFAAIFYVGSYALYVRLFLTYLLGVILYSKSLKGIKFSFNIKQIVPIVLSGLPLLINALIWTVVQSIDKFVILGFMDETTLGYYSIATLGFSTLVIIPQTISNVYYIKMNNLYGRTNDVPALIDYAKDSTFVNSLCTCFTAIVSFYLLPIFIELIMPKYAEGTAAAQIIIIGVAIYSSTFSFGHIFTILKKNKDLLTNSILLCVFNAVFSVGLVLGFGKDIIFVAIGTSLSYALYSVLLVLRLHKMSKAGIMSMLRSSWLVVLCSIIPCVGIYFLFKALNISIYWGFAVALLTTALLIFIFFRKELMRLFKSESFKIF